MSFIKERIHAGLKLRPCRTRAVLASPLAAACVQAPLIDECSAALECKLADAKLVSKYCFFVLEVLKAWIEPSVKHPQTIHHLGRGHLMVPGESISLRSNAK